MKHINIILIFLLTVYLGADAQPTVVKNASKSVFKLTTYKQDGTVLAGSYGVFVGDNGVAVSNLAPFIGADKAVVTDAKGHDISVTRILGINSIYDVVKFRVDGKTMPLSSVSSSVSTGSQVWLVPYSSNVSAMAATVKNVETFMDKYSYYIFSLSSPDGMNACPFVNSSGQVVGLMQPSTTNTDTHATDVRFITDLHTTGLSLADATMQKIGIPSALPADKEQALLTLMMSEQSNDSIKHLAVINDFISQYPNLIDGYNALAQVYVNSERFDKATKEMEMAIKKVDKKDEAHYNYSKLIYNKEVYKSDIPYKPWSLDVALNEAKEAYTISPQPLYQHQQAQILFSKGEYQTAYDMFMVLTKSSIHNPELYYEASRCKQMMKAPAVEVIALLDSAINNTDTLRLREAAPYFYSRAETYASIDSLRQAVFDYTRYEILVNGNVNASFYYMREQIEFKARLYKQALNDIMRAILLDPKEPTYYAEKASLELKVNMVDDALKTAQLCINLAPDYADGYLILGLAQISKKDTATGLSNLEKAKRLGSNQAQTFIDKYSKNN